MSRIIKISKGYLNQIQDIAKKSYYVEGYSKESQSDIEPDVATNRIRRVLNPEIDVFTALPTDIYKNDRTRAFLDELRKCLLSWDEEDLQGIILPKLRVTEYTETTIVLEWIFNYFRLYFSFDKKEGDFYGEIMSDIENGKFHNCFQKMEMKDYPYIAEAEIAYAVMMAEGGK